MIKHICDICGEEILDNYKIVTLEWHSNVSYFLNEQLKIDTQEEIKEICPGCWFRILDYATKLKKDPHIHIITDEEYHKL